jgi:hypothetical protein
MPTSVRAHDYGFAMDLSTVDEIAVTRVTNDQALIRWRQGAEWSAFDFVDEDTGYVDPEDVLWWLLRQGAPIEHIRVALAQPYPDFDVDGEIDHATMPDRDEWRNQGERRRSEARRQFKDDRRSD